MVKEKWKDVKNYEGIYQISNLGNLKSLTTSNAKIINGTVTGKKYRRVGLTKNKITSNKMFHIIIAEAFFNYKKSSGFIIDHIDNNPLNNRVDNLQIITQRENCSKDKKGYSSNYIGVSFDKSRNKWVSQIQINGKDKFLGRFINELEASKAYQNKLKEING
tara:strand:+ start:135 stop:620 length:486 start_codon:yes stop_codon:yes gene_type:complete